MAEALEESAQRIAAKGRAALLDRLRGAFEEAAAAHADVLELSDDKLERMIQDAADRADGLQWRRALAAVATEELGIGLAEALGHPAVARAQAIVGAPSYEEGLAAIAEGKPPEAGAASAGTAAAAETTAAEEPGGETAATGATEAEATANADAEEEGLPVGVEAIHLDGLPELEGQGELELQFSQAGLKVSRAGDTGDQAALVSFTWGELRGIEVHPGRARVLRRRSARLILSTNRRRARFEARGVEASKLKERLAPALAKVGTDA